jgi:hypothetical protein
MDLFQIVISAAIFVTVTFFVILSVQLFFILKELRKTVGLANEILEDVEDVSGEVKKSVEVVGSSVRQITTALDIVQMIRNKFFSNSKHEERKK